MATIENFILKFKVEGKAAVDGIKNSIGGLKDDLADFANVGGPFSNTIGGITGKLGGLGTAALGAAAVFGALGMKAINLADEIQDMADATGIGADQLLNFKTSLIEAGGNADTMAKAASKLSVAIGESATGNEKYQKSFKELGVTIRDGNGALRDSGDILTDVLSSLASIQDPAVRGAKAVELLGKEAAKIDWSKVTAGKDAVTKEQIAAIAEYRGELDKLQNSIETSLITSFGKLAKAINDVGKQRAEKGSVLDLLMFPADLGFQLGVNSNLAKQAADALKNNISPEEQANEMKRLTNRKSAAAGDQGVTPEATLKAIEDSRLRIKQSGLEAQKQLELSTANDIQKIEINAKFESSKAIADIKAKERLSDTQKAAEIAAKVGEINAKRDNDIANARRALNVKIAAEEIAQAEQTAKEMAAYYQQVDQARLSAFDQVDAIRKQSEELQGRFDLQQRIVDLSTLEQDRQTKLFDLEQQRKQQLDQIAKNKDLPYNERLVEEQKINAEFEKRIDLINKEATVRAQREQDFSAGVRDSMRKYEESLTPLKRGQDMANAVFSNMDSSLRNFVDTGKFNFKDFANSVIRDLIMIELRASTVSLFKSVFGGMGTALGFRASGGPVSAGQPYVVGERGAELFVPSTGGTIMSQAQLGGGTGGMGSGGSNVVYNINAVDAMSFKQLVARDPAFIYAVTQQGARAVPATRR